MHYFNDFVQQIFTDYEQHVRSAKNANEPLNQFPESQILEHIDNTWKDTAKAVFNNWLGKIYQLTNQNRRLPFMEGVDPNNPFDL
jgi:homoserine O-succinyltransferase